MHDELPQLAPRGHVIVAKTPYTESELVSERITGYCHNAATIEALMDDYDYYDLRNATFAGFVGCLFGRDVAPIP